MAQLSASLGAAIDYMKFIVQKFTALSAKVKEHFLHQRMHFRKKIQKVN